MYSVEGHLQSLVKMPTLVLVTPASISPYWHNIDAAREILSVR